MPRAIALFSGGLDSVLATRLLLDQGWQVHGLNVETPFACCKTAAARAAHSLGIELTVLATGDDYFDLVRRPRFGYGKGANPCIDCRIYMAVLARRLLEDQQGDLVVTGEILGQRPKSQKRRDLEIIEYHARLTGRLLRPLSARLLPPTQAEQAGLIDRERLFGFTGRSRKAILELAQRLGVTPEGESPSTGCALTQLSFAPRVRDLKQFDYHATRWGFELLNYGRHFRFDAATKIVVGRNAGENALLRSHALTAKEGAVAIVEPSGFVGPSALIIGPATDDALRFTGQLMIRYSREVLAEAEVTVSAGGESRTVRVPAGTLEGVSPL